MLWSEVRAAYLEVVHATPDLVGRITAWDAPALGSWDVAGLVGHMIRSIDGPTRYLAAARPPGTPSQLADAAAYYAAYLERRSQDNGAIDAAVAARGASEGADAGELPGRLAAALAAAKSTVAEADPDTVITSPFGTIPFGAWLRSRTFELVVHGLDLAHALGSDWSPPAAARKDSLLLLIELADATGHGDDLLLAATGRSWVAAADVVPLLV